MNIIPPLESYGLFTVRTPYTVSPTTLYRVTAHRTYEEIGAAGLDPFQLSYAPVGLSKDSLQSDRVNGAIIVTLQSLTDKPIYIPSTYILSYPGMDYKPYSRLIGSVDMGALADDFDVALLAATITSAVSDRIGITPTVEWHKSPHTGSVSLTRHKELEEARQAAIRSRTTDHSEVIRLTKIVSDQVDYIARLEEIIESVSTTP